MRMPLILETRLHLTEVREQIEDVILAECRNWVFRKYIQPKLKKIIKHIDEVLEEEEEDKEVEAVAVVKTKESKT